MVKKQKHTGNCSCKTDEINAEKLGRMRLNLTRSHDKGISVASKRAALVNKHNILHHPHFNLSTCNDYQNKTFT